MSRPTRLAGFTEEGALPPSVADAERALEALAGAIFPIGFGELTQLSWELDRATPASEDEEPSEAHVEAKLRAAEMRYRTLVEQIPAVTFMAALGEGENEIYVSPHIETMLGFTQKEWLENPFLWYAQLHPDDRALWNEEFARGVRSGGPFRAECRFLARDGHIVWVRGEARLVKDKLGRPLFLQGVAFDITEGKRAEQRQIQEAIRSTEARYRDLVEGVRAIFWETDRATGRVTFVSTAAESLLGFPRERWLDDPDFWLSRVHEDERGQVAEMRDKALEVGGEHVIEFRVMAADQRIIWMQATMREPLPGAGERFILGLMVDVTARKEAADELARLYSEAEQARAAAEAASRSKDDFLATLSHELRTPLNALLGYAQLLRAGEIPPERMEHALKRIESAAVSQSRLVDDLLDVSRIITGKLSLNVGIVDLGQMIVAAIETIRPAAAGKHIALAVDLPPYALSVPGDHVRLQQVIWNLLSNAVKFTPDGGNVRVSLASVGRHARVRVADSGIGIEAAFLPHVFDRFRQADESQTRVHGGLGLGLAIVRHLVELHGGSVHAESAGLGQGATFLVDLPRTAATIGRVDDTPRIRRQSNKLSGVHVLLVDDDGDALDLMSTALAAAGATVVTAQSVAAALDEAGRSSPDVLVSDIAMPGRDGNELLRQLSEADSNARRLPAIAVSAFAGDEHRRRALDTGFADYLTKPVSSLRLVEAVAQLLETNGDGDEN